MKIYSENTVLNVYTDGGCVGKNPSDIGITWAFCLTDENDEIVAEDFGFVRMNGGTNNVAELYACVKALECLDAGWSGRLFSDSKITLGRLFEGWAMKGISKELADMAVTAVERLGAIVPVQVDGHPTKKQLAEGIGKRGNSVSKWNVRCDYLCNLAKEGAA